MNPAIDKLNQLLSPCRLCPRHCGVNRHAGQTGACGIPSIPCVSSASLHFGEEACLVGHGGSGAIFITGCNLHCVFCQNYDISQQLHGDPCDSRQLLSLARNLIDHGCENINFVTPTHVSHAVAETVIALRQTPRQVPVVYNCGGYESVETLKLLDGLIDIYMPDYKYAQSHTAQKYSGVPDYPGIANAALTEMARQVGPLQFDPRGVACRGVLVRHLVMPNDLADSRTVIENIARVAPGCTINIMSQYRPEYHAHHYPELMDYPKSHDIHQLKQYARELGLKQENI